MAAFSGPAPTGDDKQGFDTEIKWYEVEDSETEEGNNIEILNEVGQIQDGNKLNLGRNILPVI